MTKQLEFDFGQTRTERTMVDLYTKPAVEYFKRALEYEPVQAVEYCRRCGVGSYCKEANVAWRRDFAAVYCTECNTARIEADKRLFDSGRGKTHFAEYEAEEASNAKPKFKVGDKVYCKYGGVGVVASIVDENVSVFQSKTYVSRIHNNELTPVIDEPTKNEPILSTDSTERKATPLYSGCLMYFPLALAAVARHSQRGNDKHNPGEPLHWAREKSTDQMDCILRHAVDVDHYNEQLGEYEEACALAWRALAKLQLLEEKRLGR